MHKIDLLRTEGAGPEEVELNESVIWIDGQYYWVLSSADPHMTNFSNILLFLATTAGSTENLLEVL